MNPINTRLFSSILSTMTKRGLPKSISINTPSVNGVRNTFGNIPSSRTPFAAGFSSFKWPEGIEEPSFQNEPHIEKLPIFSIPQMFQIEQEQKYEEKNMVLSNDPRDYEVFYFEEKEGRKNRKKRKEKKKKI